MKLTIATTVLCDDQILFEQTVAAVASTLCASVIRYINEDGQSAGRDQGHPTGTVSCLADMLIVAWNHGADLFRHTDS